MSTNSVVHTYSPPHFATLSFAKLVCLDNCMHFSAFQFVTLLHHEFGLVILVFVAILYFSVCNILAEMLSN